EVVESRNKLQKTSRFNIRVTVAYGSDTDLVQKLLIRASENHPFVSKKVKPTVWMRDFGDKGLVLDLFIWSNRPFAIEKTRSEIRFQIDRLFRENGISIPFPQRDVHLIHKPSDPG